MFRKNKELEDIKCIYKKKTIKWYKVVKVTDRSCFVSLAPRSALAHRKGDSDVQVTALKTFSMQSFGDTHESCTTNH